MDRFVIEVNREYENYGRVYENNGRVSIPYTDDMSMEKLTTSNVLKGDVFRLTGAIYKDKTLSAKS